MSTPAAPDGYTCSSWLEHEDQEETIPDYNSALLAPVAEQTDYTRLTIPDKDCINSVSSITTGSVLSAMAAIDEDEDGSTYFNVEELKTCSLNLKYDRPSKQTTFNL